MTLSLGLSGWLLAGLALTAVAGSVWLYARTVPRLDGASRWLLTGLRLAALLLVVFLLVEPMVTRSDEREERPLFAVLVDDSQSMVAGTNDSTAVADAAAAIISQLASRADIRTFRFGGTVTETPLDSLAFSEGRTDLSDALLDVESLTKDQHLVGLVLLSDGRYNSGRNPIHVAERFPVPIHAVALGDTTEQRDVQVRRVLTNQLAYRDIVLPIDVGIRHSGFPGERVTVRVSSAGRELDQAQVTLPAADGETTVRLEVLPDTTGLIRYDISVSRSAGEFTYQNNTDGVSVRVLDSRRKILLLAGAPSPDLTAFRAELTVGEEAEMDVFVRRPSGGYFQGALPDPSGYDLAVLVGFPSAGTDPADLDRLAAASLDGLEMLFILDSSVDLRLMQRLGESLPVQPRVLRTGRSEGAPVSTPAGSRHPVLQMPETVPQNAWASLPPLTVTDVTWRVAPDATVLANTSIRGIELDDPLLVIRKRSGTRSAALLAYGLWRWKNLPETLSRFEPVFPTLVENLARWLGAPEDDRPVRITPSRVTYEGDEAVEFFGQVYDDATQPVSGADITIEVDAPDGTTFPYTMRSVGSGRYRAAAGTLPEGVYTYRATASLGGAEVGRDGGTFSVGPLALEFRDTQADIALMRQIARRSGGSWSVGSGAEALAADILTGDGVQPRIRVEEASIRLWQRYPFLLAILLLLTSEWFLRKRRGLV